MKGMTDMKFKKLASLVLTGAMIASMSMSAFAWGNAGGGTTANTQQSSGGGAASSDSTGATIPVGSSVQTATIDIDVATATDVIINPYQISVELDSGTSQDKFLSAPVVATNKSTTKVDVTARVTVTANGDAKIVSDASTVQTASTDTPGDKNVYVALLVADVGTTAEPVLKVTNLGASNQAVALGSASLAAAKYKMVPIAASGTEVGFGSTGDTDTDALTLAAGSESENYFAMQLFGDVNSRTSSAWTANDTISASIVLTFKAQPLDVSTT